MGSIFSHKCTQVRKDINEIFPGNIIKYEIFSKLDLNTLIKCHKVCRKWRYIINEIIEIIELYAIVKWHDYRKDDHIEVLGLFNNYHDATGWAKNSTYDFLKKRHQYGYCRTDFHIIKNINITNGKDESFFISRYQTKAIISKLGGKKINLLFEYHVGRWQGQSSMKLLTATNLDMGINIEPHELTYEDLRDGWDRWPEESLEIGEKRSIKEYWI